MSTSSLLVLSDQLITGTVAAYLLALPLYAVSFAYGRRATTVATTVAVREPVLVGSAGIESHAEAPQERSSPRAQLPSLAGRYATVVIAVGWLLHLAHTVTLGLAAGRLPWGTMGEFVSALVLAAVGTFLVLLWRHRIDYVGAFVVVLALTGLGFATTVLDRPLPQLAPALQSYWIAIHVSAAFVAAGANTVGTVLAVLYLFRSRYENRPAGRLPAPDVLYRLAHRTVVFAFPLWTFAIITGAIWAEAAWGRYWGWDPKETWAFIAWVGYAAYLHARSTAGWKARRTAAICCVAYVCVLFNLVVVNVWITGLHSYAGL